MKKPSRTSRREFLKAGLAGIAGASILTRCSSNQTNPGDLSWVLQDKNVHTTIPAFSNYEEMLEDLSVMEDLNLTPEESRDLKLGTNLGLKGLFCQQCRQCQPQCPAGLEIPGLMRAYMYAFGHNKPHKALETLKGWSSAGLACRDCAACTVLCALGFDVRSRALELASFLENA